MDDPASCGVASLPGLWTGDWGADAEETAGRICSCGFSCACLADWSSLRCLSFISISSATVGLFEDRGDSVSSGRPLLGWLTASPVPFRLTEVVREEALDDAAWARLSCLSLVEVLEV